MGYCLVVPYRNREQHLVQFVNHYSKLLDDVPIYLIEQADDKPFNKAKLMNIGFLELKDKYDIFIFHDIDLLIDTDRSDVYETYKKPKAVAHTATHLGQFGYKYGYKQFFGGVHIFTKEAIEQIQGWTNEMYGWGHEDDELRDTILKSGIDLEIRETYYHSLPHTHEFLRDKLKENGERRKAGRDNSKDGINHCHYTIKEVTELDNYCKISVFL